MPNGMGYLRSPYRWVGPSFRRARLGAATYPFLQKAFGRWVTSTDLLAAAMLELAMVGSERKTLNTAG